MPPPMTAEDVVKRIASECAYVDERGAVGIRLKSAAAIVRQYGEQFRRAPPRRRHPPKTRPCFDTEQQLEQIYCNQNNGRRKALEESSTRADELAADGDHNGAPTFSLTVPCVLSPAALSARAARGIAYTFGGRKGSRTGSGLSLARIALSVRRRGENG